ncbi:Eco57I restriction-modification methylase domain-containing protein [Streptomyces sp. NPDC058726]|uniref:Eco57I restriction-modification methylase domain-containing protein n=1 Tax=Streptomyces sp. NPDC058726 TaxID=3346611 RepID=UPI00368CD58E
MSPRPATANGRNRGVAAAIAHANDGRRQHLDWLNLVDVSGPFLTLPVLLSAWPQLDALDKPQRERLSRRHAAWQKDQHGGRDEWIAHLLGDLLEWGDALVTRGTDAGDAALDLFTLPVPDHDTELRPDFALVEPGTDLTAEPGVPAAAKRTRILGTVLPPGTRPTARLKDTDGTTWSATPADRLARLLRHHHIPLGIVTDGRWWCLVWAPVGGVTTTAVFDTVDWNTAAERDVVRAWVSLLRRSRFFSVPEEETLVPLLRKSLDNQEDVTDALGVQVRQAVELLVDAVGRADTRAMERGAPGLHAQGVTAAQVYRGSVAVMMRVVFLLFAEERGLLPADNEVYATSYSAGRLCAELEAQADAQGEGSLDYSHAAWHRLIALFHAVYGGVEHPELRLPAYDGSIFDPMTYWWLEGMPAPDGTPLPLLPIDDRTVLHMLASVQYVTIGGDKRAKSARQLAADAQRPSKRTGERRKLTFRALDVEQIGYVYEGLLSYDGRRADDTTVGLIGPLGKENEIALDELERLAAPFGVGARAVAGKEPDLKGLAKAVVEAFKDPKPGIGTVNATEKALAPLGEGERRDAELQLFAACRDRDLTQRLLPFYGLIRADLRGYPTIINAGALYVTESALRKNTGTHYTPRSLAEEVVEGALEPLVYKPGPLQTGDKREWKLKSPEEILGLKVADIAMGSAAFLVAACRYLADRLIEARAEKDDAEHAAYRAARAATAVDAVTAVDAEADPLVIRARREIIEHCLYGADINPLAVEMAKLSLWLVSMDPERPFTFLDDRLVAGDALLGIANLEQLETVHLDTKEGRWLHTGAFFDWTEGARRRVAQVAAERRAIAAINGDDIDGLARKRAALRRARDRADRLELIGDLVAGAGLASAGGSDAVRSRTFSEAAKLAGDAAGENVRDTDPAVQAARDRALEWLATDRPDDGFVREPVHWPLVFPEVFEGGGFDAVVGNPPFLGGKKISGAMGDAYREYLVSALGQGKRGNADLVAYFLLRAHQLLGIEGQSGLIATNTLAQGDTREVGLDQLHAAGVEIRQAVKSAPWPSKSAVLEFCAVWASVAEVGQSSIRRLDGRIAPNGITSSLNPSSRSASWCEKLQSNSNQCFIGNFVNGIGFVLDPEEASQMIAESPNCDDVLFDYLNGQDLNGRPDMSASRKIIDFGGMSYEEAKSFPSALARAQKLVKPQRDKLGDSKRAVREKWWQYEKLAPGLRKAISPLEKCIAIALVSKVVMPAMVPTGQVFAHKIGVFASDDPGLLAILSSAPHYWWALDRSSTMKADLNYSPTDVFETFVRPSVTDEIRSLGARLHSFREELMRDREAGLTATYNLVHDPASGDPAIDELRTIHRDIDVATVRAYGWEDLLEVDGGLDHGFHETDQGTRYTIGLAVRTEILDRLRELNHQAYADEVYLGLHKKPKKYPDMPPPSAEARRRKAERLADKATGKGFDDDGLFPPDNALF